MDGWAFLEERNRDEALRSIPVIVVSALRGVEERVKAARASFLPKSGEVAPLIDRLSHLSGRLDVADRGPSAAR